MATLTVADTMPEHPKITAVGGDAAWLWLCALAYCKRNRTDGVIRADLLPRLSDRRQPMKLARRLLDEGLMHEAGHSCEKCAQPLRGRYVLHDYIEWQGSVAEEEAAAEALEVAREAKGNGGAYGNHRRWHVGRGVPDPSCEHCQASHIRSPTESADRSHMRSATDPSSDPSSESDANRISDDQLPLPPQTPPSPTGDITPPTPPPGHGRRSRRQAYDYGSDVDFLRFWEVFPVKSGKPAAFRAWLKALARGATAEVIIAAAERYRDDPRRNPEHTKYPQGWLNDERYLDAPGPENRTNGNGRHFEF